MLYFFLVSIIISKLINLYIKIHDPKYKVLIGIITGLFLGMLVQSCFEAWWDSPGAPEFFYTWILIGIVRGLEISLRYKQINYAVSSIKT